MQNIIDITDINTADITAVKDTVILHLSDGGDPVSTNEMTEDFKKSIEHVLTDSRVQSMVIRHDHSSVDYDAFINTIYESSMSRNSQDGFIVHRNMRGLQIIRSVCIIMT